MDRRVNDRDQLYSLLALGSTERAEDLGTQLERYREALKQEDLSASASSIARTARPSSIARTARFGASADRLGLGFAIAYYEATRTRLGGRAFSSLAVTERGGALPRTIQTAAAKDEQGYKLSGAKSFVTLGGHSESILILAKEGALPGGRVALGLFRVPAAHPALERSALPETPFTPELTHASIRFSDLTLDESARLEGDGYRDWVRTFVVAEERHILAAILGYRIGLDRIYSLQPNRAAEDALLTLLELDPEEETIDSLNFLVGVAEQLISEPPLPIAREEAARYQRDLRILQLGAPRRAKRLERLRQRNA